MGWGALRWGPCSFWHELWPLLTACAGNAPTVKNDAPAGRSSRRRSPTAPVTVVPTAPPHLLGRLGRCGGLTDHFAIGRHRGSRGNAGETDRSREGGGQDDDSRCHFTLLHAH